jgi:hypothetical protein
VDGGEIETFVHFSIKPHSRIAAEKRFRSFSTEFWGLLTGRF